MKKERESNNAGKVKENILLGEHLIVDGMREDMDSLINDDVIYIPHFYQEGRKEVRMEGS